MRSIEQESILKSIPMKENVDRPKAITSGLEDIRCKLLKFDYPLADLEFFRKGIRQEIFVHENYK